MRIVRNIEYVNRRKRLARWTSLLGFGALATTFWLALNPALILVAYGLLFVGFMVFNYGMQQMGKWSRNPRNDMLIDEQLKRLSDKYTMIHFSDLGKRTVEHMLVYPGGVLVLTAREVAGKVSVQGDRWRRTGLGLRRVFGFSGPQLGNPSIDSRQDVKAVETFLAEHDFAVDVEGAVIFVNPLVELDTEESNIPAVRADELAGLVSQLPADESLSAADRLAVQKLLSGGREPENTERRKVRRRPVKRRAA